MPAAPSLTLSQHVATCPECRARVTASGAPSALCPRHEPVWRLEQLTGRGEPLAGDVGPLLRDVLAREGAGSDLLDLLRRQASALNIVWEAHVRGATRLPDEVAETVRIARERGPDFLAGRAALRGA